MDEIKEEPEDVINISVRIRILLYICSMLLLILFLFHFLSSSRVLEGMKSGSKLDEAANFQSSKHPGPT